MKEYDMKVVEALKLASDMLKGADPEKIKTGISVIEKLVEYASQKPANDAQTAEQKRARERDFLLNIACYMSLRARDRMLSHAAKREAEDRLHQALDQLAELRKSG